MNQYCYSPRSIREYCLPGLNEMCEAGSINKLNKGGAVWNLFWLSTPTLDFIPGTGMKWHHHYAPVPGAAASLTADVILDETLYRKLGMHPTSFAVWFEREDQTIYDAYELLGERMWVDMVLSRAHIAAARLASEVPALTRHDNVIHTLFGSKRAA